MWQKTARFVLHNRIFNIAIIIAITVFMAFQALDIKLSYVYSQMLPSSDSTMIEYAQFRKDFEEDGSIFSVGIQTEKLNQLNVFNQWYDITEQTSKVKGVRNVYSLANCFTLVKDTNIRKFRILSVFPSKPANQTELDSNFKKAISLPFYEQFLYNTKTNTHIMVIWISSKVLNSKERTEVLAEIKKPFEEFGAKNGIEMHYSGLPYIRTIISKKVENELKIFVLLSLLIAALILAIFFRSLKAVVFPMLIVVIGVIWTLGTMVLLGYNITMLSGIIPPILIIIGMENCIYLLTKYHDEYIKSKNKIKALSQVIHKVGYATFLTNATTAVGFGSFIVTGNDILVEFGIVSAINIMLMFIFSIILIPAFYSFFKPPVERHTKHLDIRWLNKFIDALVNIVQNHRLKVLLASIILLVLAVVGVFRLHASGSVVDDIPHKDKLYSDLLFFEKNLSGIMPLEIAIDTKKNKGVFSMKTLRKIDSLQTILTSYPAVTKPLSVVEVAKFARQAFFNGKPENYTLPDNYEKNFIMSYLPDLDSKSGKNEVLNSFIDTSFRIARVSVRLNNINSPEINSLVKDLRVKTAQLFPPQDYKVTITGTSVVFAKGTNYLIMNLVWSVALAITLITFLMWLLFRSLRMVILSMIPNLIPLLTTAALMGFLDISIKPSTIIIYSIALGISVDSTIHLLSRFKMQLKKTNSDVKPALINALRETSHGMIYSGIVLVLGFAVFIMSRFGGTQALGYLIAFTLLIAVFCNLLILPSLILYFEKRASIKAFRDSEGLGEDDDE